MNDEAGLAPLPRADHPVLREYPLQSQLLQLIPAQAQKTLSTFNIDFTCIDADGHYIAIGTNIGIVYLYDRLKNRLSRLRNEHKDAITCVKILISLECLVVFGCKNGDIFVFKVPFESDEKLEKFSVTGLHNSSITALEWVKNGLKFFSGDENGTVVCTNIDHFEHQCRSNVLVTENSKIVQLSYSRGHLVISTAFRSFIYSCENGNITKIGQKERKVYGPFGAVLYNDSSRAEEILFAARPGQRLWKSDKSGVIHETMIFKTALSDPHSTIPLLSGSSKCAGDCEYQFGKVTIFLEKYLLVSSDFNIVILDPVEKSIVASCPKLDPIVDVTTSNDEIFVLRGLRHVVRISTNPDPYLWEKVSDEPSLMEEILIPLKGLSTFVKERSDSLSIQAENSLFDWLKKKRSVSSPPVVPEEHLKENDVRVMNGDLPEVVPLQPTDCPAVVVDPSAPSELPRIFINDIGKGNESEDIVYKPKKKHKKKVRFRSLSPHKKDKKPSTPDSEKSDVSPSDSEKSTISFSKVPLDKTMDSNPSTSLKSESDSISVSSNFDSVDSGDAKSISSDLDSIDGVDTKSISSNCDSTNGADTKSISSTYDTPDCASSDFNANSITDADDFITSVSSDNINEKLRINIENIKSIKDDNSPMSPDPYDIYKSYDDTEQNLKDSERALPASASDDSIGDVSNVSSDPFESEPPKYGTDWLEFRAPENLVHLCLSNEHIFCVDACNRIFYSTYPVLGLIFKSIDQPADKIVVSPNETIVWVLYKGTVFAASQKSSKSWIDAEWISIARDVVSLSVDDDCGWYVTSGGHLTMQSNLTSLQPFTYPQSIRSKFSIVQVSCWNKVVWVLSAGGSLYSVRYSSGKTEYVFKQIELDSTIEVDSIFLGIQKTGWIVDSSGVIRFIIGITSNSPEGIGKPYEVEASQYFMRNPSQLRKVVQKALNNEMLTNLIKGKQHICLSTSSSGIWFCKTLDSLVYSNQKSIIGHKWDFVTPPGTASSTKWELIAAGGVCSFKGSIWCISSGGELFCLSLSSNTLIAVDLPSVLEMKDLIPTNRNLWLLSSDGTIYVRRGITPNCPQGVWWQSLDLAQLNSEKIIHVSCGFEIAWACTDQGRVIVRLGSLCPSSERRLPQAWIPVSSGGVDAPNVIMEKVYSGPLGFPVWAIDNKNNVFVREGVTPGMPIGKKWTLIPELHAKELCISKNAVWLLKRSGKIFRRFGVTERNPCGDYWKQIPGNMDNLSVSEDDDLWGIKDDGMFQHFSYVLNVSSTNNNKKIPIRSISEDDWEDIMDDAFDDDEP